MSTSRTIDRRALVTTALAGATAIAATAIATRQAASAGADAELLELGKQLDALMARYELAQERWRPHSKAWARELAKMRETVPNSQEAWDAAWARVDAAYPIDHETPDDVLAGADDLCLAITELPATTIEGLGVKARLTRFNRMWDSSWDGGDWEHMAVRQLVEAVEALARNAQS